jgi:D-lactate dehydrogenase
MRVGVFSSKSYDRQFLAEANRAAKPSSHELTFLETHLGQETAVLGASFPAVCVFVNDRLDAQVLATLAAGDTRLVVLRCAGFNNVDVGAAATLGLAVTRVPSYSPYAVAEHTVALLLTLARKLHRAVPRIREGNFALDGLLGIELHGRTVGIVGTGKIGATLARVLSGFGVTLLAADPEPDPSCRALGVTYLPLDELLAMSDVVTLHCPLTPGTRHLISDERLSRMKRDALLINTGRGALITVFPTSRLTLGGGGNPLRDRVES